MGNAKCSDCNRIIQPEKTFGHKFRIIHNLISKLMDNRRAKCEERLTGVQCATLRFLIDHQKEDVFQKDIEAAFSITGATATNILKGMEKRELLKRVPTEQDARLKKLILTERAFQFNEGIRKEVMELEAAITDGMTAEEKTIFSDLLDRAILNIEKLRLSEEE